MESLEDRKREIRELLVNNLFVERYESFKESVDLINKAFESFELDFRYSYNNFCDDFLKECMSFMDNHSDIDIRDPKKMYVYTPIIVMHMITKVGESTISSKNEN